MKIADVDGKVLDTDKMSDKKAAIVEAINNLYKVCEQYNITFIARAIVSTNNFVEANYLRKGDPKSVEQDGLFLVTLLNDYVSRVSGGQYAIMERQTGGSENFETSSES
jgi:hypothetical protein